MTTRSERQIGMLMIVDDSSFDQMVYERIVGRSNVVETLLQFTNPLKALAYLKDPLTLKPDLILLDVNMPGLDGFEFLEQATEDVGAGLCPVVIMLTTALRPCDEVRARSFDIVQDFLNKPLTDELLTYLGERARRAALPREKPPINV